MRAQPKRFLPTVRRYPTIGISLFVICLLVGVSIYTMIRLPLSEALDLWYENPDAWVDTPWCVPPAWTNLFRKADLPETIIVYTGDVEQTTEPVTATTSRETLLLTYDYDFTTLPSEVTFFYQFSYGTKRPQMTITWVRPDGSELELWRNSPRRGSSRLMISDDIDLEELFAVDANGVALDGPYALRISILTFESEGLWIDGRLVVYGGVYGLAGTDGNRRDLMIALLWGTPVALMFGILATIGTTIIGFILAAIGSWFGGWIDATIQRVTEVGMMIPFLPTIMMVGMFYSRNLWVLLGFIIGLNVFTGAVKSYRAMFLQVKSAPYIEAARAYGAGNGRIISRYMIPHVAPVLLPQFVLGVPRFVFLEASLALLGVGPANLITWGNVLADGRNGLYMGFFYWVLEPAFLLVVMGVSFSMLGYALDRVFNPRLRDI